MFFLFRWIKNLHLFTHTDKGEISVKDAATKVFYVIDQVLIYWQQYEALFKEVLSDSADAKIDEVKAEVIKIKVDLQMIATLPDVADKLKDYHFSKDNKKDEFYHSLISTAAIAFNDGQISLFEGLSFAAQIAVFVKENK